MLFSAGPSGAKVCTFNDSGDKVFLTLGKWDFAPADGETIVINDTLNIDVNFRCDCLQFMSNSSFFCSGGSTLTITGDIMDANGDVVINVESSIKVKSSLVIPNVTIIPD